MARLFGFSIEDNEKTPPSVVSPVPPNNQDGSENYVSSGFFGSYVDIEGVYRNESDFEDIVLLEYCLIYENKIKNASR